MHHISGSTADEVWAAAAKELNDNSDLMLEEGRNGPVRELVHAGLSISDPRQRWVLSRHPAINPAFAIVEAFWILSGRNDASLVNRWNPSLPKFAGQTATYDGAYGYRLRKHFGVDQVEQAIDALNSNPSTRQVALQIWSARDDLPFEDGRPRSLDVPCNAGSFLRVKHDALHWLQVLRSNDLNRGTPYNFVQFTLLQEFIAGCLGIGLGGYTHICNSLHVYEADRETFSIAAGPTPRSRTSISLPRKEAFEALQDVEALLDRLSDPELDDRKIRVLIDDRLLPDGHQDLLLIAAADIARRNGWVDAQFAAESGCNDPMLRAVWKRWCDRFSPAMRPEKVVF
ncbi:hypothetical protein D4A92_24595 (plasmid) [Rhizobium rosettiformans]|jgi:thymidylate synthase|uniref:thymidylate synthase n=1 Tax=Rhizobium rosettiformans TaxID=1368430 RepID=A0ABX7F3E4_9HYPH|nr:thymidylate synthase [Rhizobium rosettiformans]QRF54709.1 hypothetical protein D4A92_24595 [Rhizobium rosettiformans]